MRVVMVETGRKAYEMELENVIYVLKCIRDIMSCKQL